MKNLVASGVSPFFFFFFFYIYNFCWCEMNELEKNAFPWLVRYTIMGPEFVSPRELAQFSQRKGTTDTIHIFLQI